MWVPILAVSQDLQQFPAVVRVAGLGQQLAIVVRAQSLEDLLQACWCQHGQLTSRASCQLIEPFPDFVVRNREVGQFVGFEMRVQPLSYGLDSFGKRSVEFPEPV